MLHTDSHPLAGKTVIIRSGEFAGEEYRIEDWWDRVAGRSWQVCDGNPACLDYAMRAAFEKLPIDNEVIYGKFGSFGKLIHISQLGEPATMVETL